MAPIYWGIREIQNTMPKTRKQKELSVQTLDEKLAQSKSLVFANFSGLKVKDATRLRRLCKAEGAVYEIDKKTLLKIAFAKSGISGVDVKSLPGAVAVVYGLSDEVAPAKILEQFSKTNEAIKIIGGVIERRFITAAEVIALAKLPSKQQLLAKLVGTINAPLSGLVNVLVGNLRGFVQVLNAIKDQPRGA